MTTDVIEKMARACCYHSQYYDDGDTETLVCQECDSPADCKEWDVYSLSFKREAQAAAKVLLEEMMEQAEREFDLRDAPYEVENFLRAFAVQHNIEMEGGDA